MQKRIPAPPQQHGAHIPPPKQPHSAGTGHRQRSSKHKPKSSLRLFGIRLPMWGIVSGLGIFLVAGCLAITLAATLILSMGRVPPGVSVLGVDIGLTTHPQATAKINNAFDDIRLRDGSRIWTMNPSELGIRLDAEQTAQRAIDLGFAGVFGAAEITPIVSVNTDTLSAALTQLQPQIELPPRNASIRFINGTIEPIPAQPGRILNIGATVAQVEATLSRDLADGTLELVMQDAAPAVTDATPLVEAARGLLANPLRVLVYDPFTDQTKTWLVEPPEWSEWLRVEQAPSSALGVRLTLDENNVTTFLQTKAQTLKPRESINIEEATRTIIESVEALNPTPTIRIYEQDRVHIVQAGETITSIAWDYGIPYPYIEAANPTVSTLSAGQTLTIPSREVFFEHDIVPSKRIVVSISGNWTKVYEDGALKWDWVSSTGINDSPTWTGIYQIISHEENAYAGNWNLYMPWFMGVYKPIPGSGFTNGFHGFPTRGGGQLLWENSLGTRVTYGCILLSDANVRQLYDWAEEGVIVEILP